MTDNTQPSEHRVVIASAGLVTPVGLCSMQTAAEVRSGQTRFAESDYLDARKTAVVASLVPAAYMPPVSDAVPSSGHSSRELRLICLAGAALQEVMHVVGDGLPRMPIAVALPELEDPARSINQASVFAACCRQAGMANHFALGEITTGRAGGLAAMAAMAASIRSGTQRMGVVLAVDSYATPGLLAQLEAQGRLKVSGGNGGLIPGEAAAALLLADQLLAEQQGWPILAEVQAWGAATEPGYLGSPEPYRGDGWAAALHALNGRLPSTALCVYLSLTGESFGAKEWGVAMMRHRAMFDDPLDVQHPADCLGDTGAASGVLMAGLACWPNPRKPMSTTLILAANDGPDRGALVLAPLATRGN